ncbi:protein phosphatase 1 regulatory subunit 15B [Scomber japonicus]|uniref:protein phosphatase 1 regulatory subunit 15B n=1 Tax=Scomber japonicus TaxID=13676 RepID=UPI0023060B7F|nr:protein phosphatase 1 regulatory subunit 15B [Scomber japonicus]
MFRNWSAEPHLSSPARHGGASAGLEAQESSWIGLLSVVSRPAVTFLQRYLGRGGNLLEPGGNLLEPGWTGPGRTGPLQPGPGGSLAWLTEESLRDIGIQTGIQTKEEMDLNMCPQTQGGYLSSARTVLSQVLLTGPSRAWGGSWGGEDAPHKGLLSGLSWAETKAQTQRGGEGGWTLGEHTGPADHKEANYGGLLTTGGAIPGGGTPDLLLRVTGAACSEVALLTPDQDHGYSSLEEEHVQTLRLLMVTQPTPPQNPPTPPPGAGSADGAIRAEESSSGRAEEEAPPPQCQNKSIAFIMGCPCSDDSQSESSEEDDDGFDSEGSSELSEDDDDEEDEDDDDDDDEGGDSEDSEAERLWASLSRSQDPYDLRNFTARLHTNTPPRRVPARPPSSTQSSPASSPELPPVLRSSPELPPVLGSSPELPPVLRSSPELPPVLGSSPELPPVLRSSPELPPVLRSSPELPPVLGSSPLTSSPLSSSPPSGLDSWDDSGSEAEEAQSFLNSFSSFSDPYSLFNFQAPIRTRGPQTAPQTPPDPPHHNPTAPSRYRKKESGFSEPTGSSSSSGSSGSSGSSSQSCGSEKKVRFCDDVEEFFTSGGDEDRRGPWEQLARDRCRFLRRCQEVELSIGPVLQPLHRRSVYARIARSHDLRDDTMNTD